MSEESALVLWFNERRGKTLKLNDRGMDIVISALERQIKLNEIGFTEEVIKNYKIFEDECIAKGFTFKSILDARDKQIPKKVKYEDVGYDNNLNVNCFSCICPNCDLHIIDFNDTDISDKCDSDDIEKMFHLSMVHHAYIGLNGYCNRCGQKLDWREK